MIHQKKQKHLWKEKIFEENMRTYIDEVYFHCYRGLKQIHRANREDEKDHLRVLDIEFAVDTILEFNDGTILTFQEKTLQATKQFYQQFTLEYYNDPKTKEKGEWFKLAAQRYFFGYASPKKDGLLQFWMVDVPKMREYLMYDIGIEQLEKQYLRQNHPPCKANFFAIPFNDLEQQEKVVIYRFPHSGIPNKRRKFISTIQINEN